MTTKHIGRTEFKLDGEAGQFAARIAVFNEIDKDGDVTVPGAFPNGQAVKIAAWGHNWGDLPVGKGVIEADDHAVRVKGQFFLNTDPGRNTYETVKALGDLQEWSYGYEATEVSYGQFNGQDVRFLRKVNPFEASPVLVGAGNDTGTEQIKSALAYRKTATTDVAWDGNAMWRNLPSEQAALRAATAWVDPEGNADTKAAYKFIHHMVSAGGDVGAANLTACRVGIAVLNGARVGTTIPDADRQGVYNHLAHHLKDADLTPPDLKAATDLAITSAQSLADESETVLAAAAGLAARFSSLAELRRKEGRTLSQANRDRLATHRDMLTQIASDLDALLAATAPADGKALDASAVVIETELILARLNGVAL